MSTLSIEGTSPSGWYGLASDHTRFHRCSLATIQHVWDDIIARHLKSASDEPRIECGIKSVVYDMGGMHMIGMPYLDIALPDGRAVAVFVDQANEALITAREHGDTVRESGGVRFVKLYGAYTILVLTESERDAFVSELARRLPEAEGMLTAFMQQRHDEGLPANRQELADHLVEVGARVFMPEMLGAPKVDA